MNVQWTEVSVSLKGLLCKDRTKYELLYLIFCNSKFILKLDSILAQF